MVWSLNIGRIAGTAIRIHVTFLLFLVWVWASSYASGGAEANQPPRRAGSLPMSAASGCAESPAGSR